MHEWMLTLLHLLFFLCSTKHTYSPCISCRSHAVWVQQHERLTIGHRLLRCWNSQSHVEPPARCSRRNLSGHCYREVVRQRPGPWCSDHAARKGLSAAGVGSGALARTVPVCHQSYPTTACVNVILRPLGQTISCKPKASTTINEDHQTMQHVTT